MRNTRSGCGIRIVKRPSGVVTAVMPFGRPVRVVRIRLGHASAVVHVARGHERAARVGGRRVAEDRAPLAVRDRDRDAAAGHAGEEDRRPSARSPRAATRASNCSERLRTKCGQFSAPGMIALRFDIIWQPLHDAQREGVGTREERLERVARAGVEEDRLGPALARAQHVAVGEPAAGRDALEVREADAPGEHVAHVHVVRVEAGAVEGRGHLHLAVHALLAQHRDLRPRALGDVRRGHVLGRVEREMRVEPRVVLVEERGRIPGPRTRGCRAGAGCACVIADHARCSAERFAANTARRVQHDAHLALRVRVPDHVRALRQARLAQHRHHGVALAAPYLQHRAQLLVEERGEHGRVDEPRHPFGLALAPVHVEVARVHRERVEVERDPGARGERHLAHRREERRRRSGRGRRGRAPRR